MFLFYKMSCQFIGYSWPCTQESFLVDWDYIWDTKDQTQVGWMQGKGLICCTIITPAPKKLF